MVKVSNEMFRKLVKRVAPLVKNINDRYIAKTKKCFLKRLHVLSEFVKVSKVQWGSLPDRTNDPFLGRTLRYSLLERMRRKNPLLSESYRLLKNQETDPRFDALWRQILNEDNWDSLVITLKQTLENAGNQSRLAVLSKVLDAIKANKQSYNDIVQLYNILHSRHHVKYYDDVNNIHTQTRPC